VKRDDFFIGWAGRLPRFGRWRVAVAAVCFLAAFALLPLALARATDDPGDGGFDWDGGEQTVAGILTLRPYPTLWRLPDASHPLGHTIVLAGLGKEAPDLDPASDGQRVEASGFMIRRGDVDTLQVSARPKRLDMPAPAVPVVPLGTWRISGEICDGKCAVGAMRPGTGIAHRPCANLCLIGGLPAVLFATGAIEGSAFFLLGDRAGGPLPDRVHDLVALPVTLEGVVERRGDLLILRTDLP
jgi:hypothetical protein